jgi:hypothetical protein
MYDLRGYGCYVCGERHVDIPTAYRLEFPVAAFDGTKVLFEKEGELCKAGEARFILANLELPITHRPHDTFAWTCWFSLSHASYERLLASWESSDRENEEPAFGYLSHSLPTYEPWTLHLKARVHSRPPGIRPWIELEPTEHPLAREQATGISADRIARIFHVFARQHTDSE